MDYRFKHPLYTNEDEELAINHIVEYLENNNVPEHNAISNISFTYTPPIVPSETTRQIVQKQYGVNIINIANILMMQDLFFRDYMPHISRYLDLANVKYYFSFMRPSLFTPNYIIRAYLSGKMVEPLRYWDSDILWTDYSYKDNDYASNLTNPINNFYSASLILFDIDNEAFMDAMDRIYNKNSRSKRGKSSTICIKMLPSLDPSFIMNITKLIHKYF